MESSAVSQEVRKPAWLRTMSLTEVYGLTRMTPPTSRSAARRTAGPVPIERPKRMMLFGSQCRPFTANSYAVSMLLFTVSSFGLPGAPVRVAATCCLRMVLPLPGMTGGRLQWLLLHAGVPPQCYFILCMATQRHQRILPWPCAATLARPQSPRNKVGRIPARSHAVSRVLRN